MMSRSDPSPASAQPLIAAISHYLVGKETVVENVLITLLARGHVLLEDVPGVGKTTLAYGLGNTLERAVSRIQFTSDLLPADVLGISMYEGPERGFRFEPGPIFADIVLADEINRASPRTQSALLEAMERGKVTVDGATRALSEHFFVIATQNPVDRESTFPLPEAQLDRFAVRLSIGYPEPAVEQRLMMEGVRRYDEIASAQTIAPETIRSFQEKAAQTFLEPSLLEWIHRLILATRQHSRVTIGVSPRGAMQFCDLARTRAALHDRDFVAPEDVEALAIPALAHRLMLKDGELEHDPATLQIAIITEILQKLPAPHHSEGKPSK